MSLKILKFTLLLLTIGAAACSDSGPTNDADAYVTNAENVLQRLNSENATAIAFQVKPPNAASCKHMYIEFGKKGVDGKWDSTIALNPGKDKRDNFGQYQLSNEIHFSEIDAEGDFGVLALGCKPHNKPPILIGGLIATFDVTPGKLNYIGELALIPTRTLPDQSFFGVEVSDRGDFALDQIRLQLPELESHLTFNTMQKYVEELPPNIRAELDKALADSRKKTDNANLIIDARNTLVPRLRKARETLDLWDEKHNYPENELSDNEYSERKVISLDVGSIVIKIERYDEWIERDVSFPLTQKYMKLERAVERASKAHAEQFPSPLGSIPFSETLDSAEIELLRREQNAREELHKFADKHGL